MNLSKNSKGEYTVTIKRKTKVVKFNTRCTNRADAMKVIQANNFQVMELMAKAGLMGRDMFRKLALKGHIKVTDAIDEWADWLAHKSESTHGNIRMVSTVQSWARHVSVWSKAPDELTLPDVDRWINRENNHKLATKNMHLASLRSFFGYCKIRNYLDCDWSRLCNVKRALLTHEQKTMKQKRLWTDEEYQKFTKFLLDKFEFCRQRRTTKWKSQIKRFRFWYIATVFSRHTGLRLGDVCNLEWGSFVEPGFITVFTDKRNVKVRAPITPEMEVAISIIKKEHDVKCFPAQSERYNDPERFATLSAKFSELVHLSRIEHHTFHELRATKITEMKLKGETPEAIAAMVGHRSSFSQDVYDLSDQVKPE